MPELATFFIKRCLSFKSEVEVDLKIWLGLYEEITVNFLLEYRFSPTISTILSFSSQFFYHIYFISQELLTFMIYLMVFDNIYPKIE